MVGKQILKSFALRAGIIVTDFIADLAVTTGKIAVAAVGYDKLSNTVKERFVKGWINFNGTGVVAIRDDYNVASITDLGATGSYRITWGTDFANDDYAVVGTAMHDGGNYPYICINDANYLAGSTDIFCVTGAPTFMDSPMICVMAIGDQ